MSRAAARLVSLTVLLTSVGLTGPARATHEPPEPPEYSSTASACFLANDVACARISSDYRPAEDTSDNYWATYQATGSTRLLPGWLDMRVTIRCLHECQHFFMPGTPGSSTTPHTRSARCSFLGGTSVSCTAEFRITLDYTDCGPIVEVDMAATTRFGPDVVALPAVAYARRTEVLTPCPWRPV